ncbi:hypothetical protein [Thalassolituus sp.]|uniref:hypothetical protein n=1 Tax=Thalassolituus sp. TaxID=2030822 RepID=UPI003511B1A9
MSSYEFEDAAGNRYRLRKGAGPDFIHPENLCSGSSYRASMLLNGVSKPVIQEGFTHFYFDVLARSSVSTSTPRAALEQALADNYLTVEKIDSAFVVEDHQPDTRSFLKAQIQTEIDKIIADERREAEMHDRQLSKESVGNVALIYLGGFAYHAYRSGKELTLWLKEVSDLVNPVVRMEHRFKAMQAAKHEDNIADALNTYTNTYLEGEKRELVEALGFDPSAITLAQLEDAMAMTSLIWDDPNLRMQLTIFIKNYVSAQHSIEFTEALGAEALGIILSMILIALTAGAALPAVAINAIRKFKGLGELLAEYARVTHRVIQQKKQFSSKGTGPGKLESVDTQVRKTDAHGAETGKISKKKSKKVEPESLAEATSILAARRNSIAAHGYQPKYSDAELKDIAETGDIGKERFQVRFMESKYLTHRETPDAPLSGAMGQTMQGASGTGAKYWSTSFDQLEDADSDPKLISEKLGLTYNPEADYALVIVDTQAAAPITGVKSVSATFKNVGEFANTELPDDFPKSFTDKAMTPEFQAEYSKHYKDAEASGAFKKEWSSKKFENYLNTTDLDPTDKDLMIQRFEMHGTIGNNDDYLGNGLTKNNNPAVNQKYGAVETLNFERNEVNLSQLKEQSAISVLPELSRI